MKLTREEAAEWLEPGGMSFGADDPDDWSHFIPACQMGAEALRFLVSFSQHLQQEFDRAHALWDEAYSDDQWRESRRDALEEVLDYFKQNAPGGHDEA